MDTKLQSLTHTTAFKYILTAITQFICAFLLSRGIILESFAPLGAAFAASCSAFMAGEGRMRRLLPFAAFLGAVVSYLIPNGDIDGLKYASAVTLAFSTGIVFRDTDMYRRRYFMPLAAMISITCTNMIYILAGEVTTVHAILYIAEALVCGCASFFYLEVASLMIPNHDPDNYFITTEKPHNTNVSDVRFLGGGKLGAWGMYRNAAKHPDRFRKIGILAGCASMIVALSGYEPLAEMSVGRILALLITLAASTSGAFAGAAIGLCTGLAVDLSLHGLTLMFAAVYALIGLISGAFHRFGAFRMALAYVLINTASFPWTFEAYGMSTMYEGFTVSILFLLSYNILSELARTFLPTPEVYLPKRQSGDTENFIKTGLIKKLETCRDALRDFCTEMNTKAEQTEPAVDPISRAFESVTERVCRSCPCSSSCWGQAYTDTKNAFNDASLKIRELGRAAIECFPPYFTARCVRIAELTGVLNEGLSLAEASRQLKMQKYEDLRLMRAQYSGLTAVIGDMADGIDTCRKVSSALLKPTIGIGVRQKKGEERSGDSVSYFKTENGELYMIISDGMGSGKKAATESGSFVRLLEGFIKAGMRPDTALRLLCPAYAIKCEGDTFTTCDILRVDLHNGETEIFKCGAAPTYIKDRATGTVRRVTGSSIPAGVLTREPIEADRTGLILHKGDIIIMISDGVTDPTCDGWLTRMLTEDITAGAGELAGRVLEIAAAKNNCGDDLSVLVAALE